MGAQISILALNVSKMRVFSPNLAFLDERKFSDIFATAENDCPLYTPCQDAIKCECIPRPDVISHVK